MGSDPGHGSFIGYKDYVYGKGCIVKVGNHNKISTNIWK